MIMIVLSVYMIRRTSIKNQSIDHSNNSMVLRVSTILANVWHMFNNVSSYRDGVQCYIFVMSMGIDGDGEMVSVCMRCDIPSVHH